MFGITLAAVGAQREISRKYIDSATWGPSCLIGQTDLCPACRKYQDMIIRWVRFARAGDVIQNQTYTARVLNTLADYHV